MNLAGSYQTTGGMFTGPRSGIFTSPPTPLHAGGEGSSGLSIPLCIAERDGVNRSSMGIPHLRTQVRRLCHTRLQQAVAASFTPVQHIDSPAVRVVKDKEVVAEQLHLVDGLLLGHRNQLDLLTAHDLGGFLGFLLFDRYSLGCGQFRFERLKTIPGTAAALALIATDLAVHLVYHHVNRRKDVGLGFVLGAQNRAPTVAQGKLRNRAISTILTVFVGQVEANFGDMWKVPIQPI